MLPAPGRLPPCWPAFGRDRARERGGGPFRVASAGQGHALKRLDGLQGCYEQQQGEREADSDRPDPLAAGRRSHGFLFPPG